MFFLCDCNHNNYRWWKIMDRHNLNQNNQWAMTFTGKSSSSPLYTRGGRIPNAMTPQNTPTSPLTTNIRICVIITYIVLLSKTIIFPRDDAKLSKFQNEYLVSHILSNICKAICKNLGDGWPKSIVLENKVVIDFDFRHGAKKSGFLNHPLQSYGQIYFNIF